MSSSWIHQQVKIQCIRATFLRTKPSKKESAFRRFFSLSISPIPSTGNWRRVHYDSNDEGNHDAGAADPSLVFTFFADWMAGGAFLPRTPVSAAPPGSTARLRFSPVSSPPLSLLTRLRVAVTATTAPASPATASTPTSSAPTATAPTSTPAAAVHAHHPG